MRPLPPGRPVDTSPTGVTAVGPGTGSVRSVGPPTQAISPAGYAATYDDAYTDSDFRGTSYADDAYGEEDYDLLDETYDDEEDGSGSGRRAWARLGVVVGIVVGVLLLLVALLAFWVNRQINPSGSPGEDVVVELQSGQSTAEIAQVLNDHGVIGDPRVFTLYARFRSKGDIQAGVYELQKNMSMGDVLSVLAEGPEWEEGQATVREGLTVDETVELLAEHVGHFDEARLREALEQVEVRFLPEGESSLEGMLFPETYNLDDDTTELQFIQSMVDAFEAVHEELGLEAGALRLTADEGVELSPYDVLIVASLIEKEAGTAEDRTRIARVIYNRLEADAPLGIDATSCYLKEESPCVLTAADLASDSPYNTREEPGLPPTPIASPGRASIEAALNPADGPWFFYILDVEAGDGSHLFTDDRDEFNEAKERCEAAGRCG